MNVNTDLCMLSGVYWPQRMAIDVINTQGLTAGVVHVTGPTWVLSCISTLLSVQLILTKVPLLLLAFCAVKVKDCFAVISNTTAG